MTASAASAAADCETINQRSCQRKTHCHSASATSGAITSITAIKPEAAGATSATSAANAASDCATIGQRSF
jgi:hypothetical protein